MGYADEFLTYIDTSSPGLTVGTNLFAGEEPGAPDDCVTVYEYGGLGPDYTMGSATDPELRNPRLQVVYRSISYDVARAGIETLCRLLEGVNLTIGGADYRRVHPIQEPIQLGQRDGEGRVRWSCNFQAIRA